MLLLLVAITWVLPVGIYWMRDPYLADLARPTAISSRFSQLTKEQFEELLGPENVVNRIGSLTVFLVLLVVYLFVFSVAFFPLIPEQFGGGRPRTVQLILFADALPEASAIGVEVENNGLKTKPLLLLWEGEDSYLLSSLNDVNQQQTGKVDKQLVAGLLTFRGPESRLERFLSEPADSRVSTPVP
jgi:hypothetical protein